MHHFLGFFVFVFMNILSMVQIFCRSARQAVVPKCKCSLWQHRGKIVWGLDTCDDLAFPGKHGLPGSTTWRLKHHLESCYGRTSCCCCCISDADTFWHQSWSSAYLSTLVCDHTRPYQPALTVASRLMSRQSWSRRNICASERQLATPLWYQASFQPPKPFRLEWNFCQKKIFKFHQNICFVLARNNALRHCFCVRVGSICSKTGNSGLIRGFSSWAGEY